MCQTWVGRVSDPEKNGFHKKCKQLDNIVVYLITSFKSKWKNKQIKIGIPGHDNFFKIYFLEGNSRWSSWCQITDYRYLKGSIVKLKFNFWNALENKRELL